MKKILIFLVTCILGITFNSCDKGGEIDVTLVANSSLSIAPSSTSESDIFKFSTNSAWSVELSETKNDNNWVSVSPMSGAAADNIQLNISVSENESLLPRTKYIKIKAANKELIVTLTQEGNPDNDHLLNLNSKSVDYQSDAFIVNIETDDVWEVSNATDWITVTPSNGSGNTAVTVRYNENTTIEDREAQLLFISGDIRETFNLEQAATKLVAPTLSLDIESIDLPIESGSLIVNLVSNKIWASANVPSWITLSPSSGMGDAKLTLSYLENDSDKDRVAQIAFVSDGISKFINITQASRAAAMPMLSLAYRHKELPSNEGEFLVDLSANSSWEIVDIPSWLTITPSSGVGSAQVRVAYEANTMELLARKSTVNFKSGDVIESLDLVQNAKDVEQATLDLDVSSVNVEAMQGSTTVNVSSNGEWSVVGAPQWVDIAPVSSVGNRSVAINYQANEQAISRSGVITFRSGLLTKSVTITQSAAKSLFGLDVYSKTVNKAEGRFTLMLSSNSAWSIKNIPSWVNISANSGVGNTSLEMSYSANNTAHNREATITFMCDGAEYSFTIIQTIDLLSDPGREEL